MGDNLVNYSSNPFLSGEEGLIFIDQLFANEDIIFCKESEYNDTIYWGSTYTKEKVVITIESGRGCLGFTLYINNNFINLYDYYNMEHSVVAANQENITLVFCLMFRYLKENRYV